MFCFLKDKYRVKWEIDFKKKKVDCSSMFDYYPIGY